MSFVRIFGVCLACLLSLSLLPAEEKVEVGPGMRTECGVILHAVESTYQSQPTLIRVLLPEPWEAQRRYPVIYVLPVEAGVEDRYGDGLKELQQQRLHQRSEAIFVAPTFARLPWYADHPTDATLRQEAYFLQVVVPYIDKTYLTQAERQGRLLLGFSKSGWGAWSLILRHPDLFEKAVAWDAPLMLDQPGKYGSGPIFGTAENFAAYRITDLLSRQAAHFRDSPRLMLLGYGNFRSEHEQLRPLLKQLEISHIERDGPQRTHDWHSGWVSEAVELLLSNP